MRRHRWIKVLGVILLMCIAYRMICPVLASGPGTAPGSNVKGANEKNGDESIVGWMIGKVASGEVELSDEDSIRHAISEGERELEINLADVDKNRIVGFMRTLDSIEVGAEGFIDQAKEMYQKYSAEFVEEANDAINEAVGSAVEGAAEGFVESIKQSATDFFENLMSD